LPDGTVFKAVISEVEFLNCQTNPNQAQRQHKKIRHINPFPMPVVCERCQSKMRPCWKRIKRAGRVFENQLGYECQTRIDGQRCKQPRLKADVLRERVSEALQCITLDKKQYQRFLVGSEHYIRRKADSLKLKRTKQTKLVRSLKSRKLELLKQKAVLAADGALGAEDRKLLNDEINDVGDQLREAEIKHRELADNIQRKIIGFRKFIELSQNLHQQWARADLAQQSKISEKLLLNLTIESREIRSQSWSPAFAGWLKQSDFFDGTPWPKNLEPNFDRLWKGFVANQGYWESFHEMLYTA